MRGIGRLVRGTSALVGLVAVAGCPGFAWALGDVSVSVAKGKLSVVGDNNPNFIQITPGIGSGAFVVTGVDGTSVSGAAAVPVTDVTKIVIDMKEGQDRVELLQVDVDQTLLAKLGGDQDTFLMDGGRIKGKAEIEGGKDADTVIVRAGARIGGKLIISTGKKNDTITVNNASIGGGLRISSGSGADQITVQFTVIDPGGSTTIEAGDGQDRVDLVSTDFSDDVDFDLGNGDDHMLVQDCDFDASIDATGDDGHDELSLRGDNSFDLGERRQVRSFEDFD